ncbi:hypothetical protein HN018_19400 [Lichenicola cladoniae]|uniref:Uncharacterized protein n=1 Tax=Lichenicola cladoniae TaxID=1484109 RepID=A0A6M8HTQ7_9PROT|nr:hypothetical protein [Lichenicola cladoniae]NPD70373.1 hypothetical protein [Acetobacteraceae bacterium]QKE91909.1 hypothetical protein HN018_19400 [Lichenicola cladoniae]
MPVILIKGLLGSSKVAAMLAPVKTDEINGHLGRPLFKRKIVAANENSFEIGPDRTPAMCFLAQVEVFPNPGEGVSSEPQQSVS